MTTLLKSLARDEAGFIVSSELVLVGTIAVLSMLVGLSEVSNAVNEELEDVAAAFGSINQSFKYSLPCGHKGHTAGSLFKDHRDECDGECDLSCDHDPEPERGNGH
ncbi:MAG: branched-chain amino acid aminotransferase [Planctomycetes bacterium]|nr:branched-chain amino acid aminotransferase [Planctomycetota bacterium]